MSDASDVFVQNNASRPDIESTGNENTKAAMEIEELGNTIQDQAVFTAQQAQIHELTRTNRILKEQLTYVTDQISKYRVEVLSCNVTLGGLRLNDALVTEAKDKIEAEKSAINQAISVFIAKLSQTHIEKSSNLLKIQSLEKKLQKSLSRSQTDAESHRTEILELQSNISTLRDQWNNEKSTLSNQLRVLGEQKNKYEEEMKDRMASLMSEKDEIVSSLETSLIQLQDKERAVNLSLMQKSILESQLVQVKSDSREESQLNQNLISSLKEQILKLEDRLERNKETINVLRDREKSNNPDTATVDTKIEKLESNAAIIDELRNKHQQSSTLMNTQKAMIESLESEKLMLNTSLNDCEAKVRTLLERENSTGQTLRTHAEEIDQAKRDYTNVFDQLTQISGRIAPLQQENSRLRSECHNLEIEIQRLQTGRSLTELTSGQLDKQLKDAIENHQKAMQRLTSVKAKSKSRKDEIDKRMGTLREKDDRLREKDEELKKKDRDIGDLSMKVTELTKASEMFEAFWLEQTDELKVLEGQHRKEVKELNDLISKTNMDHRSQLATMVQTTQSDNTINDKSVQMENVLTEFFAKVNDLMLDTDHNHIYQRSFEGKMMQVFYYIEELVILGKRKDLKNEKLEGCVAEILKNTLSCMTILSSVNAPTESDQYVKTEAIKYLNTVKEIAEEVHILSTLVETR